MMRSIKYTAFSFFILISLFIYKPPAACSAENMDFKNDGKNQTGKKFIVEYKEGEGFLALNKNGSILFTIYPFDNGPDYPSEGLFRIIKNGRIGFANELGKIIIEPQFSAALPFRGGRLLSAKDAKL